ncbi:MAG: hypothetical protein V4636_12920 [Pseudomonadota bacterium]
MVDPIHNPLPPEDTVYVEIPQSDASSPSARAVNERAQLAADGQSRRLERERNDLAGVLQSDAGQALIMRILDQCRPYQSTLSVEPAQFGYAEGRRSIALWLIDQIQRVDPMLYPNLLMTHVKHQRDLASIEAAAAMRR